jgi:enoyl-CoA hydratase/carnithine racemase
VPAALHVEDVGTVRVLTLSHPERRNALTPALLDELAVAYSPESTSGVRAFVLRGEGGKAFCSGYDLEALAPAGEGELPDDAIQRTLALMEAHPAPTVACIEGAAYGAGFELATACDVRVAASSARFCLPPARLGVVYAPEGLARLVSLVGLGQARRLALTACVVDATDAHAMGLVEQLVLDGVAAHAAALGMAQAFAAGAPLAVAGMRQVFTALSRGPLDGAERDRLRALRRAAFNSEDVQEGRAAFLEKRAPVFKGR